MKKIININFHSRVVPIEETAYEILQQYVEDLRRYFANEEGRDEIISDIENRFAELFSESLKKGATCITDDDVNTIIASMGRPEDFGDEEMSSSASSAGGESYGTGTSQSAGYTGSYGGGDNSGGTNAGQSAGYADAGADYGSGPRRLYRAENDKILGGVCAGLANYLKVDPAVVRILFVLFTFTAGVGFLIYLVCWLVLPTKSLPAAVRKRLYRNPDERVIGGVASGLSAYFHIEVWIPRLIFCLPLVLGILSVIIHAAWWDWNDSGWFSGSLGTTLVITYIVLWIVLPEANTASEKLEMRGEKVDLESIKNTIKNDLGNFSRKAKDAGTEVKETIQRAGDQFKKSSQTFAAEAGPAVRKTHSGIAHAIGMLFKIFFLFIAGTIAFALITVLVWLGFRGEGVTTFKNFIIQGVGQNILVWTAFTLFLVVPVVALLTWLVRRITGTRSRNHYLGYAFATLWVIGLVSVIVLVGVVMRNFTSRQHVEENLTLASPSHGRLVISAEGNRASGYDDDFFFDWNWEGGPFNRIDDDSLLLNTVRVNLLKSTDSFYHAQIVKFSHGNSGPAARDLARQIDFTVHQTDSALVLPYNFLITTKQKFRNQQVLVNVYIPVGKKVFVTSSIDDYHWFDINTRNRHIRWNHRKDDWEGDWDSDWDNNDNRPWNTNVEYTMTNDGSLVSDHKEVKSDPRKSSQDSDDEEDNNNNKKKDDENPGYRYKTPGTKQKPDSTEVKRTAALVGKSDSSPYLLNTLLSI